MTAVLLDTCAILYIALGQTMHRQARDEIQASSAGDGMLVSPASAWEIGLLFTKRGMKFDPDPRRWFERFMTFPGARITPLTAEIAMDSCLLPSPPELHGDPIDRMLIATARALDVAIVTRDRRILDYARAGFVRAIRC